MSKGFCFLRAWEVPGIFASAELGTDDITLRQVLEPSNRCNHFQLQRWLKGAWIVVSVELSFKKVCLTCRINNCNPILRVRSDRVSELPNFLDFLTHLSENLIGRRFTTLAVGLEVLDRCKRNGARHCYEFVKVHSFSLKVIQISIICDTRSA